MTPRLLWLGWHLALAVLRQADHAWTVLARVLFVGEGPRGKITVNPCERGGRVCTGASMLGKPRTTFFLGRLLRGGPKALVLFVSPNRSG